MPHGTTAHMCCTATSLGTNCRENKANSDINLNTWPFFDILCLNVALSQYSLSWTCTVAVALLDVGLVVLVPHQLIQAIGEVEVQLHVMLLLLLLLHKDSGGGCPPLHGRPLLPNTKTPKTYFPSWFTSLDSTTAQKIISYLN